MESASAQIVPAINLECQSVHPSGNLELYVISKMFRIQINVYVNKDKMFNLVSKIGNYNLSCNLFFFSVCRSCFFSGGGGWIGVRCVGFA